MKHDHVRAPHAMRLIVGALVIALATSLPGGAAEIEGVRFADQIRSRDVTLRLRCVGLLRYKLFIKAYVAALYLGDGTAPDDVLADVPKRLEINYFWSINATDFGRAGDEILKRNVDDGTFVTLLPRLDRINAWYRDVKPGDRYSLTYLPGVGTQLALNGTEIGVIDGADFGKAYFQIWLGDKPIDADFRESSHTTFIDGSTSTSTAGEIALPFRSPPQSRRAPPVTASAIHSVTRAAARSSIMTPTSVSADSVSPMRSAPASSAKRAAKRSKSDR